MKNYKELQERNRSLMADMEAMNNGSVEFDAKKYDAMYREVAANGEAMAQMNRDDQYKQIHREAQKGIVERVREAMKNGAERTFTMAAGYQERTGEIVTTLSNAPIEKEMQGILEPLYAQSVLAKLGVKFYTGLPMGDISVPVLGKGTVGWKGEIAAAGQSTNTFSAITLTPKRITAYVDISKEFIAQDTKGAEAAIRRDLANAVADKLEATIFGSADTNSGVQPAGMFYDTANSAVRTLTDGTSFAKLCEIEATVEDANVTGEMKYLLGTGAKAALRGMATNGNGSPRVLQNADVDGTPAITTSNVKDITVSGTARKPFIYGNFANLAVGSWGNVEITVDPYTQATNGCVRLVVNCFFDAKILREAAFAYGYAK